MTNDTSDGFESMATTLPLLNSVIAEAAAVVQAVDQFVTDELAVGPWVASRPFDTQRVIGDDGRELLATQHLAFGRAEGVYRLHILKVTLDRANENEPYTQVLAEERVPWIACTKENRLQSFTLLPELMGQLAGKLNEITASTSKTIETVRDLLRSMSRSAAGLSSANAASPFGLDSDEEDRADEFNASGLVVTSGGSDLFKRSRLR